MRRARVGPYKLEGRGGRAIEVLRLSCTCHKQRACVYVYVRVCVCVCVCIGYV